MEKVKRLKTDELIEQLVYVSCVLAEKEVK